MVKSKVKWHRARFAPLNARALDLLDQSLSLVRAKAQLFENGSLNFGSELRVAGTLLERKLLHLADNKSFERKLRRLFLRPAVEPILMSFSTDYSLQRNNLLFYQAVVSSLCGQRVAVREGKMTGSSELRVVDFVDAKDIHAWISALSDREEVDSKAVFIYNFAQTIFYHVFCDGNGRIARAVVHFELNEMFQVSVPFLPLAPAVYCNSNLLGDALDCANRESDWSQLATVWSKVLIDALRMLELTYDPPLRGQITSLR